MKQTLQIAVPARGCLYVDGGGGFALHVRRGEVWITAQSRPGDTIARDGESAVLAAGTRTIVSAFDDATVAVTAPAGAPPMTFMLRTDEDGARVLTVSAAPGWIGAMLGSWLRLAA